MLIVLTAVLPYDEVHPNPTGCCSATPHQNDNMLLSLVDISIGMELRLRLPGRALCDRNETTISVASP